MPFLLAIIGLLVAASVWYWRIRMAAGAASDLAGMAKDVIGAARALGFRRRANIHPVESVDDPQLAITALGLAFLELDGLPAREDQQALAKAVVDQTGAGWTKVEEMMVVGNWLISECKGPQPAIPRLARRLHRLDGAAFQALLPVLNTVGQRSGGLTPRQSEALADIARIMKLG